MVLVAALGMLTFTCTGHGEVVGIPPLPTLTSLTPNGGAQGTTILVTLAGTNFVAGATTVAVSGTGVTVNSVTVVSATALTANFVIASSAPLGSVSVTVTTTNGTSGAESFAVFPPGPTLTRVTPNSGVPGTTVAVTLAGTDFVSGATTVAVSGTGVTVNNATVVSATSLTANFVIASSAPLGSVSVTVTTAAGTSGAQPFAVVSPPTLTGVSPNSGVAGTTVAVTLAGTNFIAGATTVAVGGTGVTVNSVTVNSATSLTANFVIASSATPGSDNVTVTTPGGTTGARTFTVIPAPPTLTGVTPNGGARGTTILVTLAGTNFIAGATTVAVSGTGVTVNSVTVTSATSLTANFVIASSAALTSDNVTVTTANGTSGAQSFTVFPPGPTLTSLTPSGGVPGATIAVTLAGTNFVVGATTVAVSGTGVTLNSVTVVSATSITANFVIASSAQLGSVSVTVTTAAGTSAALPFAINPPPPTLTSVSPTSGAEGATVTVALVGTNFVGTPTVAVSGTGVTVGSVTVNSGTSLAATFVIASGASLGSDSVTVTTAGGTTGAKIFTVIPPPPTLTSVTPDSGSRSATVAVTLAGTNFVTGATTVAVSGTGVTVNNVIVASSTSITANFVISPSATLGSGYNVTVTTAGGTSSNSITFKVVP